MLIHMSRSNCYKTTSSLIVCLISFVFLTLTSCSNEKGYEEYYSNYKGKIEYVPKSTIEKDSIKFTDTEMNIVFNTDYGWEALLSHETYWDGESVQIDYYFNPNVDLWQIDAARSFSITKFYLGEYNNLMPKSYDLWLLKDEHYKNITQVYSRVFVGDDLIVQDFYNDDGYVLYENTRPLVKARLINTENHNSLEKIIRDNNNVVLNYQKSILGNAILIQVDSKTHINPKTKDMIEEYIENEFSKISNLPFTVLELYDSDGIYYISTFLDYNGESKWIEEDWMNYRLIPEPLANNWGHRPQLFFNPVLNKNEISPLSNHTNILTSMGIVITDSNVVIRTIIDANSFSLL